MVKKFVALAAWFFGWFIAILNEAIDIAVGLLALTGTLTGLGAISWVMLATMEIHPVLFFFVGIPSAIIIYFVTGFFVQGLILWRNPNWQGVEEGI